MSRISLSLACLLLAAGCDGPNRLSVNDMGSDMPRGDGGEVSTGGNTRCVPFNTPKVLSNLPGSHAFPRLAFQENRFVVAWNTEVVVGADTRHRIDAALTDRDGNKLGPNIPMSRQALAAAYPPSVTPLLGGTVVAWTRQATSGGNLYTDIITNTLDPTGQRLDGNAKPCDPADDDCGQFQVTTSGSASYPSLARPQLDEHTGAPTVNQVGLVFVDARNHPCTTQPCLGLNDVYWKKIQANGAILANDRQITEPASNLRNAFPRLAFDGVHNGVVWRDDSQGTKTQFLFATLDNLGQVATLPTAIGMATSSKVSAAASDLVWTGSEYAMATATGSETASSVVFQRFMSNGVSSLQPVAVTLQGVACTPAIAWDGEYFGVAWQTQCGQPGSNLAFALIDRDGYRVRQDGTRCTDAGDAACGVQLLTQNTTAISGNAEMIWAGGHTFGVAWSTAESTAPGAPSEIYFSRIDCQRP